MIVGVDQVLLDLVVEVDSDLGVFKRHGIEQNTQSLAEARHEQLLRDLLKRSHTEADAKEGAAAQDGAVAPEASVLSAPGGCVANSLRAAAWNIRQHRRLTQPPALRMIGRVGRDAGAELLRSKLQAAGVEPLFDVAPAQSSSGSMADHTGVCCCLIASKERTMLTELGAGRSLNGDGKLSERVALASASAPGAGAAASTLPRMVVLSGFYVQADPVGVAAIRNWADHAQENCCGRPLLALTVGAQWCTRLPAVQEVARAADFVFANEPETLELAAAVAPSEQAGRSFEEALAGIAEWKQRGWMVATRGARSVGALRVRSKEPPVLVPVQPIDPAKFVDDVGAGDAFMGGFLVTVWRLLAAKASEECRPQGKAAAELLAANDVEEACRAGIATAAAVVQCAGAQFPEPAPPRVSGRRGWGCMPWLCCSA